RAGADHVVTSPGGVTARGTVARTRLLRDSVGPRIGIKACGRFRSAEQLGDAAAAGATRVSVHLTGGLARQATEASQLAGAAR
ncbi:MAG: deoxyribose-phosphate aldolase, partial [Candidatus Limnocylindria bacterium]